MKKIEEMTIGEVLHTPEYEKHLQRLLDELEMSRTKTYNMLKPGERLHSHPIDELIRMGSWRVRTMTTYYEQALNKESTFSSSIRWFIISVGTEAFNVTMQELLKREKDEADNGNGEGK